MYLETETLLNNRYVIESVLGHGGFGITYLALDKVLNVKVAIKEYLPRQLATRAEGQTKVSIFTGEARKHYEYGLRKFLEEAQSVAQFSLHPNIVSARDYFEANGTAYMVMEYVEGVTLKEYLAKKGGRIAFEEAKGIMMPVMDALREVHQAGMLHRDVSPDNIYITTSAQVKILDFGAARYFSGEQSKSLSVILKAGYAPEEQYRSKGQQGPWTDVYATAATLYRAITGQTPPEVLERMEEDTLAPPSRLGVSMPPTAERALLQALAVNAGQRFQSMGEFQQALLGDALSTMQLGQGAVSFRPPPGTVSGQPASQPLHSPHPPRRSALPVVIAAGAITIFLVVGLIWWQVGGGFSQKTGALAQKGEVKKPETPTSFPPVKETPPGPQQVKARFTKDKDGVISDSATGLEWFVGPDRSTNWTQAKTWTDNLASAGGGWRMPTIPELKTIHQPEPGPNKMDPIFQTTGFWVWSGQWRDLTTACSFHFPRGQESWGALEFDGDRRAFAVRSRNAAIPVSSSKPVKTRFTKAKDGVIRDSSTGLEWYAGPDRHTWWERAKAWTERLTVSGGGWRMPTVRELKTLYQPGVAFNNIDPIFQITGDELWVWTGQMKAASTPLFLNFITGKEDGGLPGNYASDERALAVRSRSAVTSVPPAEPVKTRFTKAKNGVISDSATGLEWYEGPDLDTNWKQAKSWTESLATAGGGWRMPTIPELKTLYQPGTGRNDIDPIFQFHRSDSVWSGQLRDAKSAGYFNFDRGREEWSNLEYIRVRSFAVRSRR